MALSDPIRQPSVAAGQTIGPLSALYGNKFSCETNVYPRDLGTSYRGHAVGFQFVKVTPMSVEEIKTKIVNAVSDSGWQLAAAGGAAALAGGITGSGAAAGVAAAAAFLGTGGGAQIANTALFQGAISGTTTGIEITPPTDRTGDAIMLYMPETLQFSYEPNYSELSIADAVGSSAITGKLGSAITSITEDSMVKLALNKAGYVFNPQQQLLFNGINFRTYQMTFTFTPYSEAEAASVASIIQTFRRYAAPTVVTDAAGFFFIPPGMVEVTYYFNGQVNDNLHRLKRSVIESVQVDYAPNGWASLKDGFPAQTTLTLGFKEMSLVDSKDIENGF